MTSKTICAIVGCGNKTMARGWCVKHYRRWQAHGSPLIGAEHFHTPDEAMAARTVSRDNGCIEWTGARIKDGYGMMKVGGVSTLTHRYAYKASFGPIPDGMNVCHKCDNPPCCNPDHLFLGTDMDNSQDMMAKGRGRKAFGYSHGRTTLSEDNVRSIRSDKRSLRAIAAEMGMSKSAIGNIRSGKSWGCA